MDSETSHKGDEGLLVELTVVGMKKMEKWAMGYIHNFENVGTSALYYIFQVDVKPPW